MQLYRRHGLSGEGPDLSQYTFLGSNKLKEFAGFMSAVLIVSTYYPKNLDSSLSTFN